MITRKTILVLCTGNSCRSQMAEGFLKHLAGNRVEVYSAGIEVHGVNPKAVASMEEVGIDISEHTSNHLNEYAGTAFDYILTVCDHAQDQCPVFSGTGERLHHNFPDPAKATGSEKDIRFAFAHTRDLIEQYCKMFVEEYL